MRLPQPILSVLLTLCSGPLVDAASAGALTRAQALPGTTALADDEVEVDPEVVERWLERFDQLLEDNRQEPLIAHLREARELPDEHVLAAVETLLDLEPRIALLELGALQTMGYMRHDTALERLHRLAQRDRRIEADGVLTAELMRAIGRQGSVDSIEILTDEFFVAGRAQINQAKIMALGNVRSPLAVEALMAEMNKLPAPDKGKSGLVPHGRDFGVALYALTGEDLGENRNPWQTWWNDHKRDLQVTSEAPELVGEAGERWRRYWGLAEPAPSR